MRIAYIGTKPNKADNVAGTGLSWTPGQVHEVENPEACKKLLAHSCVWVLDNSADLIAELRARAEEVARLKQEQDDRDEVERLAADAERLKQEAAAAATEAFDRRVAEETAAAERAAAEKAKADADGAAAPPPAPPVAPPAGLASAKVPGEMTLDELKAFCAAKGMKFHPNIKRETLLDRLVAHAEGAQP